MFILIQTIPIVSLYYNQKPFFCLRFSSDSFFSLSTNTNSIPRWQKSHNSNYFETKRNNFNQDNVLSVIFTLKLAEWEFSNSWVKLCVTSGRWSICPLLKTILKKFIFFFYIFDNILLIVELWRVWELLGAFYYCRAEFNDRLNYSSINYLLIAENVFKLIQFFVCKYWKQTSDGWVDFGKS